MINKQACARVSLVKDKTKGMVTVAEAAEYLRIKPRTLREWAKQGNLKLVRIGRVSYLEANEVRAFLAGELGPFKVRVCSPTPRTTDTTGLIAIPAAAAQLRIHFTTIYRWIKQGKLKPVKVNGRMYLATTEVATLGAQLDFGTENH